MPAYEPWPSPRVVDGPGKGDPRVPAATAVEAARPITAAANAPIIKGRLTAVTSHRVGRPGERPVGPATFLGLSRRLPFGGRGSPLPTHQQCGSAARRLRGATG